jgi:hypothetical protein
MTTIIRVNKINIGTSINSNYDWIDNFLLKYEPKDIVIHIDIPYGKMKDQKILSPHVEGSITCRDFDKMLIALYSTAIDSSNHKALEDIDADYTLPYEVDYLVCEIVGSDNSTKRIRFNGFTVKYFYPDNIQFNGDTYWVINFHADGITYS